MPVDREPAQLAAWRTAVKRLAKCSNVFVKLGGFAMVDHHWTLDTIRPFVEDLVDAFGPDRCMFGSNFPVDGLYRDFGSMWSDYREVIAGMSPEDQRKIFHDNGARVYRL